MLNDDLWLRSQLHIPCFTFQGLTFEEYLIDSIQGAIPKQAFITLKLSVNPESYDLQAKPTVQSILTMNHYTWQSSDSYLQDYGHQIRAATNSDIESILEVGREAFAESRFHKDLRVGNRVAEEIKLNWLRNNLTHRSNCINLVYEHHKSRAIVGFVSLLSLDKDLVIDLIAVDSKFRGLGIGYELVSKCQSLAKNSGLVLRVGTQSKNIANILYLKSAFCLDKQLFILHDLRP